MKKYQLKINMNNKLNILMQSDTLNSILRYVKYHLDICEIKLCSVWMNGQVLD